MAGSRTSEREPAVFRQHHQNAARGSRSDRGQGTGVGRIAESLFQEKIRRGSRRRDAQCVDAGHFLGTRIIDQRLRLPAPAQVVPHGARSRDHGAGRVHCVAAFPEDHGPRGRGQRLSRDRRPVPAVQDRFDRILWKNRQENQKCIQCSDKNG